MRRSEGEARKDWQPSIGLALKSGCHYWGVKVFFHFS